MKIFFNANIYRQEHHAFVEDKGRIIFIGSNEEALQYPGEKINLHNKYIYPGFIDSHMHLVNYGQVLMNVMLDKHTSSLKELLDELKKHTDQKVILGRGWNHDYFQDVSRYPTREDLDSVSKDIPIAITRACGHILVANSKAIEITELHEVEGGSYNTDTGLFKENAVYLIYNTLSKANVEDIKNMILLAQESLHSYGITSIHSDDFISATSNYKDALTAFEQLDQEGKLTIRVNEQCEFSSFQDFKEFIALGYRQNTGNLHFKIGPLKLISDGSLGARTAYLSRPYHDDPSTCGIPVLSREELNTWIRYARKYNFDIAAHAIGDKALDDVLAVYKDVLKDTVHRSGIVHCQITRSDQLEVFKELKLHSYIQSIFLDYDNHIVRSRVDEDIANTSYNFKTLNEYTTLSNGSDAPVEYPDVCKGMQCAITRTSMDGTGPYLENQAFTIQEAIDSFTIQGAYPSYEEDIKGKIEIGYLCDFVVLEEDLLACSPNKIKDIQVLQTYVEGIKVYKKA